MNKIKATKYIAAAAVATALSLAAIAPAFAQTNTPPPAPQAGQPGTRWQGRGGPGMGNGMMKMQPGIFGTVASVNGTTLVVLGRALGVGTTGAPGQMQMTATTTFSVNAANATVYKNNATSTLSSVVSGDRVFVQGTVSGTSVTATVIRDGIPARGSGMMNRGPNSANGQSGIPSIKGNGQPVVAGTVSSIAGNSITITTSSNTTFTVNASTATVTKNGTAATASSVAVGDYIVVQGTVNGSTVSAATIIDGQKTIGGGQNTNSNSGPAVHMGFMGSIGNFFKHIFGF